MFFQIWLYLYKGTPMDESSIKQIAFLLSEIQAYKPMVGDVFFSKDSSILDEIRFYQVTQLFSADTVTVRELHQLNSYNHEKGYGYCCPIISKFISEEKVVNINDRVLFEDKKSFASLLSHSELKISENVKVKIWNMVTHKISNF